mgnify:CR=1 FL=1
MDREMEMRRLEDIQGDGGNERERERERERENEMRRDEEMKR